MKTAFISACLGTAALAGDTAAWKERSVY